MARTKLTLKKESEIISYYLNGTGFKKLEKLFKTSYPTIKKILIKNNINITPHIKYDINHTYLDKIDCQEKAYFLGFFFADGYVFKKVKRIGLKIKSTDIDILRHFNTLLCPQDLIKYKTGIRNGTITKAVYFQINSTILYKRLIQLGCTPAKSENLELTDFMIDELGPFFLDFLRGLIDGDGWITANENYSGSIGICVSGPFGFKLQQCLEQLNIKSCFYACTDKKMHLIKITNQAGVKRLLEIIYKDPNICLERKHNKFLIYQEYIKNCKRPAIFNKY